MLENWHFLSLELDQFFHAGQILDERVLAAQAREKQSLAASKVRVELMQELVTTLVAPGEVHRKK